MQRRQPSKPPPAPEDWDQLEELFCDCPECQKKVRVYWSPTRHEFLLLGFFCPFCGVPYEDLFVPSLSH